MRSSQGSRDSARLATRYVGFQALVSLFLWLPVFYEYQKRMGLSDPEIFGIQGIYYLVFCLIEIPTGFVADRFGRRPTLVAAAVLVAAANAIPVFWTSYAGFLTHFLGVALARSLASGAASAYLYERLDAAGETGRYRDIEGRARAVGLVIKVACWAVVGPLMAWSASSPYWLSAIAALGAFGFAMALPPDAPRAGATAGDAGTVGTRESLAGVARAIRASPALPLIMAQGVGLFVLGRIAQVNLYQPILASKSFGVADYGWIMSAMTIAEAVGSARTSWTRRHASDAAAVGVLTVLMAGSLVMMAAGGKAATLAGFGIFAFVAGLSFPIQRSLLNEAIPVPRFRATLLSVESILDRAVCAVAIAAIGPQVGAGRLEGILLVSAALTLVLTVAVTWFLLKRGVSPGLDTEAVAG